MRRGENIFKRKDGRWEARYIKAYDRSGRIRYGFCYGKSYKEAKDKVGKIKAELAIGKPILQTGSQRRFASKANPVASALIRTAFLITGHGIPVSVNLNAYITPVAVMRFVSDEMTARHC